jgi:hypothetical protein
MDRQVAVMGKATALADVLILSASAVSNAAELQLKPETLAAWQSYIRTADSRMQERLHGGAPFLWIDESAERGRRVRAGEILVTPVSEQSPVRVPNGLIHDWIGAAFFPNASLADILAVVQDYPRYKEFYKPLVIDSKLLGSDRTDYRFSLLMLNKSLFAKNALLSEWKEGYLQVDDWRWYSIASTTRVQEIDEYGSPAERELPVDTGSGYIWRLYSFSRFEQRDGGVYVEMEAMALSRDIPAGLRWLIDPIVRRVSRGSVFTSFTKTRAALQAAGNASNASSRPAARQGSQFR